MNTTDNSAVLTVTDADFAQQVEQAKGVTMVDFWATWCGPCRMIAPVVDELARDYEGRARIGKLDTDSNQATMTRYGVRSIPTLLVFRDGELVDRIVGAQPKQALAARLDRALADAESRTSAA